MAKSIIDIEVKAEAFEKFAALFQQYQDQLAKMPKQWGRVAVAIDAAGNKFDSFGMKIESATEAVDGLNEAQNKVVKTQQKSNKEQDKFNKQAKESEKAFARVGTAAAAVGREIASTTFNLMKWGALSMGGAIIGAGFGIKALSESMSGVRSQAMGLGMTPGELRAAENVYGQYHDIGAVMGGISAAQTDIEKQRGFLGAGIVNPQAQTVGAMLPAILKKAGDVWRTTENKAAVGEVLKAMGLSDLGITPEIARREGTISEEERRKRDDLYLQTSKELNQKDKVLYSWVQLTTQLDIAGNRLKTVLGDGLVALTTPLTKLTDAFMDAVAAFIKSDTVKKWLGELTVQLENMSKWMQTDQFKQDVQDWLRILDELKDDFSGLLVLLKPLGLLAPTNVDKGVQAWISGDKNEASRRLPATDYLAMQARDLNPKLLGLDPKLRRALTASGLSSDMTSGVRDEAKQKEMYDAWIKGGKKGYPVAAPGHSTHQAGKGADISSSTLANWSDEKLAKFDLWRPHDNDPVHVEVLSDAIASGNKKAMNLMRSFKTTVESSNPPAQSTTPDARPQKMSMNSPSWGLGMPTQFAFDMVVSKVPGMDINVNARQLQPYSGYGVA